MDIEYKNKNIYCGINYYKENNYFKNLYSKLFILFSIILFSIITNYSFKQFYFTQHKIIKHEKKILGRLNYIISDKINFLKIINNNNKKKYQGIENCLLNDPDKQHCIYHLLVPKKVIGKERILIGKKVYDGSYVLLNDFKNIKIAYSFGIERKIQFDKHLADIGIDIYMYDHTIDSLPYNNSKFHWKKIGISGKNKSNKSLKSLEGLIIENGHSSEENMILKIDIEHAEWESLKDLPYKILNQFKYIVIEYHFKNDKPLNETVLYYNVIKKLYKTHQVFYLHCQNPYRISYFGNNRICSSLEVSYVIKKDNEFTKDSTIYPIKEFDFSTKNINIEEMNLNILKLFDNSYLPVYLAKK